MLAIYALKNTVADIQLITNVPSRMESYFDSEAGRRMRSTARNNIQIYISKLNPEHFAGQFIPYFSVHNHAKIIGTENIVYSCLATTGEIVILKRGEMGYFKTDIPVSDRNTAKELVKHYNEKLGVTKQQYEAMKAGSMFGWDIPAANPQNYDKDGVPRKPKKHERGDAR